MALRVRAWAKVNLALNIVGRRPDGYHDLETVMHRIDLADDIEVVRGSDSAGAGEPAITVDVTGAEGLDVSRVPCDRGNIAFRAAQAFLDHLGYPRHLEHLGQPEHVKRAGDADGAGHASVSISIRKRIPVGAGLGGGSADAAAALVAMNQLWGKPYGAEELMAIGASIGADVPFCLMNHDLEGYGACDWARVDAAFAQGIGDRLTLLPGLGGVGLLLATPGFAVSTPDAYAMWDALHRHEAQEPDVVSTPARKTARGLAEVLSSARSRALGTDAGHDLQRICSLMSNDFEPVIATRHGRIMQIKQLMMQAGAIGALMSGSGPTVFGVFGSPGQAGAAVDVFVSLAADCGFDLSRDSFHLIACCLGDSGHSYTGVRE